MPSPLMATAADKPVNVSIAMTMHNAAQWLEEALQSVMAQTFAGSLELSVFDDASTDSSLDILKKHQPLLEKRNIKLTFSGHTNKDTKGVGYGRNQAVLQSCGNFLCIFDADDIMAPERIELQYAVAISNHNTLIGCGFMRCPGNSTERYTKWCNTLTQLQLHTQAFTAFGPTLLHPTWFFEREVFERAGPFSEDGKGTPEDLIFFYKHLSLGGQLIRVEKPLLVYRYHQDSATFGVDRGTIWKLRVGAVQDFVLSKWEQFTIWNAGKQGRRLYRSLRPENQAKVVAFCDVDPRKISRGYYTYQESHRVPKPRIPIVHFSIASPPFLLCVKWELTHGGFEANLASLNLKEGQYHKLQCKASTLPATCRF